MSINDGTYGEFANELQDEDLLDAHPPPGIEIGYDTQRDCGSGSYAEDGPREVREDRPIMNGENPMIGSAAMYGPTEIGSIEDEDAVGAVKRAVAKATQAVKKAAIAVKRAPAAVAAKHVAAAKRATAAAEHAVAYGPYAVSGATEIGLGLYPIDGASEIGAGLASEEGQTEIGAGEDTLGDDALAAPFESFMLGPERIGDEDEFGCEVGAGLFPVDGASEIGAAAAHGVAAHGAAGSIIQHIDDLVSQIAARMASSGPSVAARGGASGPSVAAHGAASGPSAAARGGASGPSVAARRSGLARSRYQGKVNVLGLMEEVGALAARAASSGDTGSLQQLRHIEKMLMQIVSQSGPSVAAHGVAAHVGSAAMYGPTEIGEGLYPVDGGSEIGEGWAAADGQSEIGAGLFPVDGASEIGALYPTNGLSEMGEGEWDDEEHEDYSYAATRHEIGVKAAVVKVVEKARNNRQPAPPMKVVDVDAPLEEDEDDFLSSIVLGAAVAAVTEPFPLLSQLLLRAGANVEPRIVRVDTEESYKQFRTEQSPALSEVKALRERLEAHIADPNAHELDSEDIDDDISDLVLLGEEAKTAEAQKRVDLWMPRRFEGKIEAWRQDDMVCVSMALPGRDGDVRICTSIEPMRKCIEEMVRHASEAQVGENVVDVLPEMGCVLGAGTVMKEMAAAAPAILARPEAQVKLPFVVRIEPKTSPNLAALVMLASAAKMGNTQAVSEWHKLASMSAPAVKAAMLEASEVAKLATEV